MGELSITGARPVSEDTRSKKMFETECRGCLNGKKLGYFLYCSLTKPMKPAKVKCNSFRQEMIHKNPSRIEDWIKNREDET